MQVELDKLLSEQQSSAKKRAASAFDDMVGANNKNIIIFGSGDLGKRTLAGLKKTGIKAVCFSDNNSKIWDTEVEGLKVLSPEKALIQYPDAVVVVTIWSAYIGHPLQELKQQLNKIKDTKVVSFIYLYWKFPELFLPYWRCDLPEKTIEQFELASAAFSLWSDDASREEYFAQVFWRITGDASKFRTPVKHDQYFPEDIFKILPSDVFVDIGAFDGDTLKVFLDKCSGNFKHYYAYEPDPFGYYKLKQYTDGLPKEIADKIDIEPIGIGNQDEKISIETPGVYFKVLYPEEAKMHAEKTSPFVDVDSKPIDSLPFKHIPTYMKMDVEGFEPNVIFGAKELIKKHNPIIAISIYHQFDHIWRLPLAVKALTDKYNFYLRPHFHAGWELICYAVPKDRVLTA